MPTRLPWDTESLISSSRFIAWLEHPTRSVAGICPPALQSWGDAWPARRDSITEYTDRAALTKSLLDSHARRGAPQPVMDSAKRLQDSSTFLVMTGQQPGLGGGPLYTLYKAIHAVVLARQLSRTNQETFLPAFWNACEDHDIDEMGTVFWLDQHRSLLSQSLETHEKNIPAFARPIAEFPAQAWCHRLLDSVAPSLHRDEVMEALQSTLNRSETMADWFDHLLWEWLGNEGLLVIRPEDLWMREQAVPIMEREIREPLASGKALQVASEMIVESGESPQIHKRDDRTAFFMIEEQQRVPVFYGDSRFLIGEKHATQTDLVGQLQQSPGMFSPAAMLRPVIQDAVLPVAATIVGPGELSYHFLLDGIYRQHNVVRPVLVPRIGFTLVEAADERRLHSLGLSMADLRCDTAALCKRFVRDHSPVGDEVEALRKSIRDAFERMAGHADTIDPTLRPALNSKQFRTLRELDQAEHLLVRREAARHEQRRHQVEQLKAALYPHRTLQERQLSFIHFWMTYGTGLVGELVNEARDAQPGEHILLRLP